MPVMLFRLRGVPEDEAEEVRELLRRQHIDFYETSGGNWGISMAAIWLRDDELLPSARRLIDEYQSRRAAQARDAYERLRREGRSEGMLDRFRQRPLAFTAALCLFVLILYFSIRPYLAWH